MNQKGKVVTVPIWVAGIAIVVGSAVSRFSLFDGPANWLASVGAIAGTVVLFTIPRILKHR